MNHADTGQLALFRPAAINLTEPVNRHQVIARVLVDDVYLYLTPAAHWSLDMQEAETYSCVGVAAAFVAAALRRDPAACELVSYLPVRRGLVVMQ